MDWSGLSLFDYAGAQLNVQYVETADIIEGVVAHVYRFANDNSRDLALVEVESGHATPLQRVAGGEETIEGWVSGVGTLTITDLRGREHRHAFCDRSTGPVSVQRGELMQWCADAAQPLVFFEICTPPYEEGRFNDL
jgi:hypothetical protein